MYPLEVVKVTAALGGRSAIGCAPLTVEDLSPAASERAERLARVTALASQTFVDSDETKAWLDTLHPLLAGARPIDAAATDLGARQAEGLPHNIAYGLPV